MKLFKKYPNAFFINPLFIYCLGLVPCIFASLFIYSQQLAHTDLKREIRYLNKKNNEHKHKISHEERLIQRLKNVDPDYVQRVLQPMTFLNGEIRRLETALLDQPQNKTLAERCAFLKRGENCLHFQEKHFQRVKNLQEVDVSLEHPVEMGREDLKCLLAKLEHVQIGPYLPDPDAPDFLIETFELIRKPLSENEETFLVKFNCIKRESIHD